MIEWLESPIPFAYRPPDDLPNVPPQFGAPRCAWSAIAHDGARLEAYRWGSPLGVPFVLEVRRYGRPAIGLSDYIEHGGQDPETMYHPARLPELGEIRAAADHLLPPGTFMMLAVQSNGPDATYPPNAQFQAVRIVQVSMMAATESAAATGRPS